MENWINKIINNIKSKPRYYTYKIVFWVAFILFCLGGIFRWFLCLLIGFGISLAYIILQNNILTEFYAKNSAMDDINKNLIDNLADCKKDKLENGYLTELNIESMEDMIDSISKKYNISEEDINMFYKQLAKFNRENKEM